MKRLAFVLLLSIQAGCVGFDPADRERLDRCEQELRTLNRNLEAMAKLLAMQGIHWSSK